MRAGTGAVEEDDDAPDDCITGPEFTEGTEDTGGEDVDVIGGPADADVSEA
ncbi:MAG: hypothetical protein LBD29_04475 [Treponema sp.]|nr:hypothetical protein [Treponema sp.]